MLCCDSIIWIIQIEKFISVLCSNRTLKSPALSYVFAENSGSTDKKRMTILSDLENITFNFDCHHRPVGFYADIEYNCQVFHMCDEKGNRIPHVCANDTSFNQEFRICDWEYNFDCADAPKW